MAIDFSTLSPKEPSKPSQEPRRFVPTLTDVVHVPPPVSPPLQPETAGAMAVEPAAASAAVDTEALVARVCATVAQGLDDHVRALVADAMQAQHMLLVQGLRGQLSSLIETLVRDAIAAETVRAARQTGDSCIQATD